MKFLFIIRRLFLAIVFLIIAGSAVTLIINIVMVKGMEKYVYTDIDQVPSRSVVMVLGAQIIGRNLSPILQDRVNGGIEMVQSGKGRKLLLSGDHGELYYDEVNAMRLYVLAQAQDIPHEDIFMDHAGFSTWDSMCRARDVFEVKDLIIVTQEFHISRAVYMARSLGIDAVGFAVKEDRFQGWTLWAWKTREYFARIKAIHSMVFKVKPRYLGDKIPITGDGRNTWI